MSIYLLTPFLTWLLTGCTKFLVNCVKEKRLAFDLIGYGGMPSNHASIVSSITALVAIREGLNSPAFGVAIAFSFIILLDASSLRRQVGKQAELINILIAHANIQQNLKLRERIGHSKLEILAGIILGSVCAASIQLLYKFLGYV